MSFLHLSIMKRSFYRILSLSAILILVAVNGEAQELRSTGMASIYASSEAGQLTASGALYDANALTACHATLPFGTVVKVTNLRTNKSVLVTINDRFEYKTNRVIDLSKAAANEIGLFDHVAPMVSIEVVSWPTEETKEPQPCQDPDPCDEG
ncbi:MAG: septal ring lytic transglycosylase RlpA family protein [Bacteroidetes bacterium]|nr:septal ring lytic transglycosylase RlpA family protein [Bacteroidota bacterium]